MTAETTSTTAIVTLADLLEQLGGIAPARVRFRPVPGAATEEDMIAIHDREGRLYELVDGVLVEKAMGLRESYLAIVLSTILWNFVQLRNVGLVTGEAGMMRLMAGLVRIPECRLWRPIRFLSIRPARSGSHEARRRVHAWCGCHTMPACAVAYPSTHRKLSQF
jgi:hypothetical protein